MVFKFSELYDGAYLKYSLESILGASIIFPGLKIPVGSNENLIDLKISIIFFPNITSLNSDLAIPSPCSPE